MHSGDELVNITSRLVKFLLKEINILVGYSEQLEKESHFLNKQNKELIEALDNADKLIKDLRLELDRERENSFT
jgi:hypothetical protein